MPYPEELVAPMRQELSDLGFTHLTTPAEVDIEGRMLDELVGRLSTLFAQHCSDEVRNAGG